MSKIVLDVKDKSKEEALISFLKEIPFVTIISKSKTSKNKPKEFSKLFGIWKDKDIDIDSIRKEAWRKK